MKVLSVLLVAFTLSLTSAHADQWSAYDNDTFYTFTKPESGEKWHSSHCANFAWRCHATVERRAERGTTAQEHNYCNGDYANCMTGQGYWTGKRLEYDE